jgi:acetoacetyl-CoA reductase
MTRVAVVTGGTRGIGRAICRELASSGYTVAAIFQTGEAAAADAAAEGFTPFKADVREETKCAEAVRAIESGLGPIDVLVNNAGVTRDAIFHRMRSDQWRDVIDVNLNGVFNMTRQALPGMRERRSGRIISISSINGQKGQVGQANYAASKAALLGFTRALALENAGHGITVNVVAPGYVETEMTSAIDPDILAGIVADIPVGRMGRPEEIARCVRFLADERSGFITGACLSVNGGQHMAG